MSRLSTHVLDTSVGLPARGVAVALDLRDGDRWSSLALGRTDGDGRVRLVDDDRPALSAGVYRLTFETGDYFAGRGAPTFFPSVAITFEVQDGDAHLHVPLLVSPYGYSTYRGS